MSLPHIRPSLRLATILCLLALPFALMAAAAGTAAAAGWEEQSSGQGSDCWLETVCAISADEAWTGGSTPSALLHTTDGGATWYGVDPSISGDLESIAFIGNAGWVASHRYYPAYNYVMHTTDGGANWAERPPASGSIDRFLPTAPDTCWGWAHMGSTPKLQLTTDGGLNWSGNAAWTTAAYGSPEAGSFVSPQVGWFVADDKVCRTTDGGGSWTQSDPSPPASDYLMDIAFVSATTGWVASGNGFVARSTDGGATWQDVSLPITRPIEAMDFGDASHGWITTGDGTIWTTTDGGTTWGAQLYQTGKILLDISAADATHAWITGTQGLILHTGDGGGPVDTTAPTAATDPYPAWICWPSTITVTVTDTGGIGPWKAEWKWESDADWSWGWQSVNVPVAAPADHSLDGLHTLTYRGVDWANNRSADQTCQIGVDTQAPTVQSKAGITVRRGAYATVKYRANDVAPNGGTATLWLNVVKRSGAEVIDRRIGTKALGSTWKSFRFRVRLKKGTYFYRVTGNDTAGNYAQSVRRKLVVN
jgi:photosystem II stability/assembly factor-like uncharacterized protein